MLLCLWATTGTAGAEASALTEEQSAALPYALFARCQYYEYVGEDASVFEALRRARARAGGGFGCYGYALALYRRGEFAQALEVLDQSRESPAELCRPYVLAELSDGPGRAREACRAIVGRHPDGLVPIVNLAALRLFGRGPEFAAAAGKLSAFFANNCQG